MSLTVVLGAGGHAKVILDILQSSSQHDIWGVTDPKEKGRVLGVDIIGDDQVITDLPAEKVVLANGIGSMPGSIVREAIFERFLAREYQFTHIIHNSAIIGRDVDLEMGVQVMAGAILQSGSQIGANSLINTKASVDHDSVLGSHVHVAPGVTICGDVKIGKGCFIGAGATITQGVNIGNYSVVGSGAVVLDDVPEKTTVMGIPARKQNYAVMEECISEPEG